MNFKLRRLLLLDSFIRLPDESIPFFFNRMNIAMAIIKVQGKPEPTPKGIIATKNTMVPTQPSLNIQPFSSIDIAISA